MFKINSNDLSIVSCALAPHYNETPEQTAQIIRRQASEW